MKRRKFISLVGGALTAAVPVSRLWAGQSTPGGSETGAEVAAQDTIDLSLTTTGLEGDWVTIMDVFLPDGTVLKLKPTDDPDFYRVLSVERPDIEAQRAYLFGTFEPELPA